MNVLAVASPSLIGETVGGAKQREPVVGDGAPRNVGLGSGRFLVLAVATLPLFFLPNPALGSEGVFLVAKLSWLALVIVPASLWTGRRMMFSAQGIRILLLPTLLVGWMFAGALTHAHPMLSVIGRTERLDGALPHLGLLITAFGGASLVGHGQRRPLGRALAISGALIATLMILQRFGVVGNLADPTQSLTLAEMPGATVGNRGYAACLVAALIPFVLEQARSTPRRARWWIVAAFLMGVAVGFAWSRGATVAALAGIVLYAARSKKPCASGVAHCGIVLLGLLIGSLTSSTALGADSAHSDRAHAFSVADSGRKPLYLASLWGVARHPVTGYGAGGVLRAMQDAKPATVLRWAGLPTAGARRSSESNDRLLVLLYDKPDGTVGRYDNITTKVHNEPLDYAISYGVPAAVLATLTFFVALWRSRLDPTLFAAIGAFVVGLLTWPQVMRTAPVLWCLLGVALALRSTSQATRPEKSDVTIGT